MLHGRFKGKGTRKTNVGNQGAGCRGIEGDEPPDKFLPLPHFCALYIFSPQRGRLSHPVPLPTGSGDNSFEFASKKAGFYAFLLRKTTLVARNRDQGV